MLPTLYSVLLCTALLQPRHTADRSGSGIAGTSICPLSGRILQRRWPFPVRMNVVVRVVESDIERHGTDALRAGVSERVATCIETERIHKTEAYEQLL